MPAPLEHYEALLTSIARLVGFHKAGRLPADLVEEFPVEIETAAVGERVSLTADNVQRRVAQYAEFAALRPDLLPANIRSAVFMSRLAKDVSRFVGHEPAIWRQLAADPDYVALCHWNANVDNAWFWRDPDDRLHCGLMDWGCVSQMNVAMAIWGAMSAAETSMWDRDLDDLLGAFIAEVSRSGGPVLDVEVLRCSLMLYVALMG